MDKNGGEGGNDKSAGKSGGAGHDPSLLDAASLFAYWNRDPAAAAAAAASNPLFSSQFGAAAAAGLGLLSGGHLLTQHPAAAAAGHHHSNTMAVAASQAASLAGLHPAASWWSMAQLAAAQDYFNRLQASGLSQFAHPDLSAAFPGGLAGLTGIGGVGSGNSGNSSNSTSGSSNSKSNQKQNRKEKRQQTPITNNINNNTSNLHNLGSNTTITPTSSTGASNSYKSSSSYNKSSMQANIATPPVSISAYNPATLHKELLAMQAAAVSAAQQQQSSSSKKSHHSQQLSGISCGSSGNINNNNNNNNNSNSNNNSNNNSNKSSSSLSSSHHHSSSSLNSHHNSIYSNSSGITGNNNRNNINSSSKDRNNDKNSQAQASLNALNSLSQLGTLGLTSQQSVQAAMNALAANSDKVKDYMPQGILSDPSSLLGVRLPPDTEIIKYTSSIVGPKIPGTTNRGRKKTISLDPNPLLAFPGLSPAKRSRLEMEYAAVMGQVVAAQQAAAQAASNNSGNTSQSSTQQQSHANPTSSAAAVAASSAAVLAAAMMGTHTLGSTVASSSSSSSSSGNNSSTNLSSHSSSSQVSFRDRDNNRENSSSSNRNDRRNDRNIDKDRNFDNSNTDRVEVIKLPPTITSNGAYNLSNKSSGQLSISKDIDSESSGINLSFKSNTSSFIDDSDTPLNLSMKPSDKASANNDYSTSNNDNVGGANSLQSLSSITAALGNSNSAGQSASGNNSNSGNNNDRSVSSLKEGRPRNLGRGVSKPKKNTVASLLAQSRAVGIKPMLATQQLLQQGADLEKIRQVLEANSQIDVSTDSESVAAESGLSESESEDPNIINLSELRIPLDMGWKRETIIRGLTKLGQIRGDVCYYAPNSNTKLKNVGQILTHLDKNPSKLNRENFSFSSRAIIGSFLQPAPPPYANDGEFIRMSDIDVAKRLEDLKMFTRQNLNVEQRIEIAKQQQAIRDAKKLAKEEMARSKEKARQEKNEKLEQQRKERELKNQQAVEARKKRQEELERIKQEEILKKQQELNKQKELLYQIELERERKRQHMSWIRQLDNRRKFEEREKKKHQLVLDRLILRERRVASRKRDAEILLEIRKPIEDSEIVDQVDLPEFKRLVGCRLPGQAMADLLMVFEFLHNFGETLGFDMESLPTFQNLHDALITDSNPDAEEELLSIMTHLLVCAIEDPGIPNPGRHTTLLGQSLRTADITNSNVSEVLRIYLYAIATGEVRQMSGITLDREKERRVADHHQIDSELITPVSGKNQQYYDLLHDNETWKLSTCLNDKPFVALNPTKKTQILAHLVNDLLMNKAVLKQIEGSLESCAQIKRDKYTNDMKIRKYKSLHIRKLRMEAYEKAQHERELAIQHQLEQNRKEAAAAAARAAAEAEKVENEKLAASVASTTTDTEGDKAINDIPKLQPDLEKSIIVTSTIVPIDDIATPITIDCENEKMEVDESNVLTSTPDTSVVINHKDEISLENGEFNKIRIQPILNPSQPERSIIDESPSKSSLDTTPIKISDTNIATFNGNLPTSGADLNNLVISNNKKINSSRIPDDASTDVGMDEDLSDVESVITTLEEDEDMKMSSDEVYKKLEKMVRSSEQMKDALEQSSNQLRAQCYGQDRYWRRYWKLPKAGGIFVEAIESAQNEIFEYNAILENEFKGMIVIKENEEDHECSELRKDCDDDDELENEEINRKKDNDGGKKIDERNLNNKKQVSVDKEYMETQEEVDDSKDFAGNIHSEYDKSSSNDNRNEISGNNNKKLKEKNLEKSEKSSSDDNASSSSPSTIKNQNLLQLVPTETVDNGKQLMSASDENKICDNKFNTSTNNENNCKQNNSDISNNKNDKNNSFDNKNGGDKNKNSNDNNKNDDNPTNSDSNNKTDININNGNVIDGKSNKNDNSNIINNTNNNKDNNGDNNSNNSNCNNNNNNDGNNINNINNNKSNNDNNSNVCKNDSIKKIIKNDNINDDVSDNDIENSNVNNDDGKANNNNINNDNRDKNNENHSLNSNCRHDDINNDENSNNNANNDNNNNNHNNQDNIINSYTNNSNNNINENNRNNVSSTSINNNSNNLDDNNDNNDNVSNNNINKANDNTTNINNNNDKFQNDNSNKNNTNNTINIIQGNSGCDKIDNNFINIIKNSSNCSNNISSGDNGIAYNANTNNDHLLPPPPPPTSVNSISLQSMNSMLTSTQNDITKIEIKSENSDDILFSPGMLEDVPKFVAPTLISVADKWFSIINREMPLTSNENQYIPEYQLAYSNITCDQNIQIQGHRWDIANNAQYFSVPIENGKVDLKFDNETILTLSGLKEETIDAVVGNLRPKIEKEEFSTEDDEITSITKIIPTVGPIIKEEIIDIKAGKIEIKLEDATSISLSNLANMTLNNISTYLTCDNTTPLSMTPDEQKQLEFIKSHGFPKKKEKNFVTRNLLHGWWTIDDIETIQNLIQCLHPKGIRERELKQNLLKAINEEIELIIPYPLMSNYDDEKDFVEPDKPKTWSPKIAKRVELSLLDQLEALEDKIANASMQVKHWQMPQRENELIFDQDEDVTEEDFVSIIPMLRERIASLEAAIERRYLKPPLGLQVGDAQLAVIAQNQMNNQQQQQQQQQQQHQQQPSNQLNDQPQSQTNQANFSQNSNEEFNNTQNTNNLGTNNSSGGESPTSVCSEEEPLENMPKGLVQWREAVARSHTTSQLAMALYVLESCVAWDKSIMKANCQFCSSGENEDKLLLCDGCDKGYHTYCFKPKMENIPEGDWYCYECLNKATNERKCIVCGGHRQAPVGKMVYCELCPRAFHSDCYIPPLLKVPRGKWYCHGCIAKAPPPKKRAQKRNSNKEIKERDRDTIIKEKDKQNKQPNDHHSQNQHNTSSFQRSIHSSHEESTLSPNNSMASTSFDDLQNSSIDGASNNKYPSIVTLPPQALPSILSMTAATPNTPVRPTTPTTMPILNNENNNILMDTSASDEAPNSNMNPMQQSQLSPTASIISNTSQGSVASSTPSQSISQQLQQPQQQPQQHSQSQQSNQQQPSVPSTPPPSSSVPDSPPAPTHQQVQQQHLQVLNEAKEKLKQEKKEKHATKKLMKELSVCKTLLADMEIHEDSWPFLLPVNTKQFPTYKKIIKNPMDLSTIKKRLQDLVYKSREEFVTDVRQIFDNCEMFNEDDSPVGKAGHGMRKFFEVRWAELTDKHS